MAIFRIIVFTKTPLRKAFRYKDVFQLVPYTKDFKPEVTRYAVDYPCFLEYSLPDDNCDGKAQWDRDREIPVLLTAFSIYRVFIYDFYASSWGVRYPVFCYDYVVNELKEDEKDIFKEEPVFYYPFFHYKDPTHKLKGKSFSEIAEGDMMTLRKQYEVYIDSEQDRYDIRNDKAEITFSEETVKCLDAYFAMDDKKQKKIYSAARLISDSIALKYYRHSLSFMAGVAALETLSDMVTNDKDLIEEDCHSCHHIISSPFTCPKCGRPIWGVTAKVKNFLKEYVSSKDEDVKNYNKIYNLRSKITHTGDIFTSDSIYDSDDERRDKENKMEYKLLEYSRRGMASVMMKG